MTQTRTKTRTESRTESRAQAVAAPGWEAVTRELTTRGLDEDEAVRAFLAAIRSMTARPALEDPARQFSEQEVEILRAGGVTLEPRGADEPDVRVETMARLAATIIGSKATKEVAQDLGVSTTRVRQRAAARTLYAIHEGDEWRFPRWQFDPADNRPVSGVAEVFPSVPAGLHPVAVERFFTEPNTDLEVDGTAVSPMAWLQSGGDPRAVVSIALGL